MFRSKTWFPDLWRYPCGGFRHGESEFEVQNDGREAPEGKKRKKSLLGFSMGVLVSREERVIQPDLKIYFTKNLAK